MKNSLFYLFILLIIVVGAVYLLNMKSSSEKDLSYEDEVEMENSDKPDRPLGTGLFSELRTDTSKTSIDLDLVFGGGPGKDGIPAINNPKFVSVNEAKTSDSGQGVLVEFDGEARFYPYGILVWHEIVNDKIGDTEFSVTFCPLCGSAIVFDRNVNGQVLRFGVSGLLFESNLLMYDTLTESLWSQARGQAVIGDFLDTRLNILPMQLITFAEMKERYSNAKVLSRDTGYVRQYGRNPYSSYEDNEQTYFPVSVNDQRFPAKEVMYVVPFEGKSYVFPQLRLTNEQTISLETESGTLTAVKSDGEITVTHNGTLVPGYFEMWFSWATHHQEDGVVWEF